MNPDVRNALFDIMAVRALAEVSRVLGGAGIPVVPVKGIVLARWLYTRPSQRPFVDVDLLVPPSKLAHAEQLVSERPWPILYGAPKMGELLFRVGQVEVELHGTIGRPDLTRLRVEDVFSRAEMDTRTFDYPILRIDDLDHFVLLVANVVKDGFTYANAHQPTDLHLLLDKLRPRWESLTERIRDAGITTATAAVARWMIEVHRSTLFEEWIHQSNLLAGARRPLLRAALRYHWQVSPRHPNRLRSVSGLTGLALATLTPDDPQARIRGLARLAWRGLLRQVGRDPG